MRKDEGPAATELLLDLREALTLEFGSNATSNSPIQDALNVLLHRIKSVAESEPEATGTRRLSPLAAEIASLKIPMTALLKQRLKIAAPELPDGEATFKATTDAHTIISIALMTFDANQRPTNGLDNVFGM